MKLLTVQDHMNDFHKNQKNDPTKPFPLAKKTGDLLYKKQTKRLNIESVIAFTIASILSVISVSILSELKFTLNGWGISALLFLGISLPILALSWPIGKGLMISEFSNFSNYDYAQNGVPANFAYSLRAWLNTKYDMQLSDNEIFSLLTEPRTPINGNRYKLVYSKDKNFINEMIMDNSCPSGCCDKSSVVNVEKNNENIFVKSSTK